MTRHVKMHMIFAIAVALAACGGSDSVNSSQPNGAAAVATDGSSTAGTAASTTSPGPASSSSAAVEAPPAAPPVPVYREVSIPAGTRLRLELLTAVSSETSTVESPVRARLTRDVEVNGVTAMPSGTMLTGVITRAERAGRVKGRSRVSFRFNEAEVRGTPERLSTNAVALVGEASTKGDAARIGGGAVAGAVIGGLLGGGKGAAEGAAIGGGAGTGVVLATRGKEVGLASGAAVTATLAAPLTLQVPR